MYNKENTEKLKSILMEKGYRYTNPSIEELVDEMLAILSDRDRIAEKKKSEQARSVYNEYMKRRYWRVKNERSKA